MRRQILKLTRGYLSDENNQIIVVDPARDEKNNVAFGPMISDQRLLIANGQEEVDKLEAEDWPELDEETIEKRGKELKEFLEKRVMFVRTKVDLFEESMLGWDEENMVEKWVNG